MLTLRLCTTKCLSTVTIDSFVGSARFGADAVHRVEAEVPPINHPLLPAQRFDQPYRQSKANIITAIPVATVFFSYTHGANAQFGDSFSISVPNSANFVNDAEVSNAVYQKLPTQPPYNFVVLMACHCGDTDALARAFDVGPERTDRAFLGWNSLIEDSQHTAEWAQHLFNRLALGDTLHDAITWADDWNRDGNMTEMVRVSGGGSVDAQVFGDRFRYKLHGVYGGTGTWWYK